MRSNSVMWRVIRAPSVVESREIFSVSSVPPWLNMSSKACRRAASMSLTASPRLLRAVTRASALSRKVSATVLLRLTMVSVMRAPVCSILETTSPPVERSVELTSSARAVIDSAMRVLVSVMAWVNCSERPAMVSMVSAAFCAKPCAT